MIVKKSLLILLFSLPTGISLRAETEYIPPDGNFTDKPKTPVTVDGGTVNALFDWSGDGSLGTLVDTKGSLLTTDTGTLNLPAVRIHLHDEVSVQNLGTLSGFLNAVSSGSPLLNPDFQFDLDNSLSIDLLKISQETVIGNDDFHLALEKGVEISGEAILKITKMLKNDDSGYHYEVGGQATGAVSAEAHVSEEVALWGIPVGIKLYTKGALGPDFSAGAGLTYDAESGDRSGYIDIYLGAIGFEYDGESGQLSIHVEGGLGKNLEVGGEFTIGVKDLAAAVSKVFGDDEEVAPADDGGTTTPPTDENACPVPDQTAEKGASPVTGGKDGGSGDGQSGGSPWPYRKGEEDEPASGKPTTDAPATHGQTADGTKTEGEKDSDESGASEEEPEDPCEKIELEKQKKAEEEKQREDGQVTHNAQDSHDAATTAMRFCPVCQCPGSVAKLKELEDLAKRQKDALDRFQSLVLKADSAFWKLIADICKPLPELSEWVAEKSFGPWGGVAVNAFNAAFSQYMDGKLSMREMLQVILNAVKTGFDESLTEADKSGHWYDWIVHPVDTITKWVDKLEGAMNYGSDIVEGLTTFILTYKDKEKAKEELMRLTEQLNEAIAVFLANGGCYCAPGCTCPCPHCSQEPADPNDPNPPPPEDPDDPGDPWTGGGGSGGEIPVDVVVIPGGGGSGGSGGGDNGIGDVVTDFGNLLGEIGGGTVSPGGGISIPDFGTSGSDSPLGDPDGIRDPTIQITVSGILNTANINANRNKANVIVDGNKSTDSTRRNTGDMGKGQSKIWSNEGK